MNAPVKPARKPWPTWAKILVAVVVVVNLLALFGVIDTDKPKKEATEAAAQVEASPEPAKEVSEIEGMEPFLAREMIPGMLPYEVLAACKKQDMVDKPAHLKTGTSHRLTGDIGSAQVSVDMTIWKAKGEGYAGGFTCVAIAPNLGDALPFFRFMASVPYKGAQPQAAADWVTANYNADSAGVDIGEAHFMFKTTTPGSKLLMVGRKGV